MEYVVAWKQNQSRPLESVEPVMERRSGDNGAAYMNGRIYTVNPQQPWAEAFTVSSTGIITAVGTNEEIKAKAREDGLICYNLENNFIMPGIHDAHVHMLASGMAMAQVHLSEQDLTNDDVARDLRQGSYACKYAYVNDDWLVARGYYIRDFDRKALDKAYPTTPVVIKGGAGHSAFLNTTALQRSGYDIENQPDEQGAYYVRDANGHLTGAMAENALSKVMTSIPQPGLTHVKRVLGAVRKRLHAVGVTSCQEGSSNTLLLQGLQALEATESLKLEIFPHIVHAADWIGEEDHDSLQELINNAESFRSKHVDTRFVKIILDGVPLEPYWTQASLNLEDSSVAEEKLLLLNVAEAVKEYDARGVTMKIHCTGSGATRTALDAYAAARASNPNGPRHEIAHCSGVHGDDYARFRGLNVTAEMSPAFLFDHPIAEASGGLIDHDFAKMLLSNAPMTLGSDWGASEEPDLLPCLGRIADTLGGGDRHAGGEILCRMLTLGGAEAVGREGDLGSIEVGKKANFIAVDQDLSEGCFEDACVLATWFEGEVVYSV